MPKSNAGTSMVRAHHTKEFMRRASHPAKRDDLGDAFFRDPSGGPARAYDAMAQEAAEGFLESATSGEEVGEDVANAEVPEEAGGPFVETTAKDEFAYDTDASNPEGAEREPFPLPNGKWGPVPRVK